MPDLPFPLKSDELEELKPQMLDMFRDIYENRLGGATLGDVFRISGDVFQLEIKTGSGLRKTNGELDLDPVIIGNTAATIRNTPAGNISATNVQDAINELDTEKLGSGGTPYFQSLALTEGVSTPATLTGKASIYFDSTLKIKFSDGSIYEIVYYT